MYLHVVASYTYSMWETSLHGSVMMCVCSSFPLYSVMKGDDVRLCHELLIVSY